MSLLLRRLGFLKRALQAAVELPDQFDRIQHQCEALRRDIHMLINNGMYAESIDTSAYRARLISEIIALDDGARAAYNLIREAIEALPDAAEREHAPLHEVRYLLTYSMTPPGPGTLVDIGASSIYQSPLKRLKGWTIADVPILAFDYERHALPFEEQSADGVLICEVIEHFVYDPMFCLVEINRILKNNAFVVLTTPNAASWFSVYQALQHRNPSRWPVYAYNAANSVNHIHAREYVVSEINLLLQAAGFGQIDVTTRDYGISPPYRAIPGFDASNRGETIFCRARKLGPPKKRAVAPIYLNDLDFRSIGRGKEQS